MLGMTPTATAILIGLAIIALLLGADERRQQATTDFLFKQHANVVDRVELRGHPTAGSKD